MTYESFVELLIQHYHSNNADWKNITMNCFKAALKNLRPSFGNEGNSVKGHNLVKDIVVNFYLNLEREEEYPELLKIHGHELTR